eukprot:2252655-Amphidinium_carterae.1
MAIKEGSQDRDRPSILGSIVPRRNGDAMVEAGSVTGNLNKLEVRVATQRALGFRQRAVRRGQRTGCIAVKCVLKLVQDFAVGKPTVTQ